MSAGTETATTPPEADRSDLSHLWCTACDGDSAVAMCGITTSSDTADDTGSHCAVCEDLADAPCPVCGIGPYAPS